MLNKEAPEESAVTQDAVEDSDISTEQPTKQEIIAAIRNLKNGKAPGQHRHNAELFKCHPELALPFFTKIWNGDGIPNDWNKGVIIPIPKKGTLSDCNNWRGINCYPYQVKHFVKSL